MKRAVTLAGAALIAAVTACGANSAAPAPGTPAANTLVCQHYLKQYTWKQNVTYPSMADALKWATYVAADSAEAVPGTKLARDLTQEQLAMQGKKNTYKNGTVYRDCTALTR